MTDFDPQGVMDAYRKRQNIGQKKQKLIPYNPAIANQRLEGEIDPYSPAESAMYGGLEGLTYGFTGEIGGAGMAAFNYITGETEDFEYQDSRQKIERDILQAREQNPGSFLMGEMGGTMVSPVNKLMAPIGVAAKLGKFGKTLAAGKGVPAQLAAEGTLAGFGMSEGSLLEDPGKVLTDTAIGAVAAPLAGQALKYGGKGLGATGSAIAKLAKNPKVDKFNRSAKAFGANVIASLPPEWGKYVHDNPTRAYVIPDKLEDLSGYMVRKVNDLRVKIDKIESEAAEMLSDKPTIDWGFVKGYVTRMKNKFDLNPEGLSGESALNAIARYQRTMQFRATQDMARSGVKGKISQKALKKLILDSSKDIYKMKADFKLDLDVKILREIDSALRSHLKLNVKKKSPTGKSYVQLMKQASEGEALWSRMLKHLKPERPTGVKNARSNLQDTQLTITKMRSLPKNKKAMEDLDKMKPGLSQKVKESDMFHRSETGVQIGTKNVATAAVLGAMGAGAVGVTGGFYGLAAGVLLGAMNDKYGRKWSKRLIALLSPHSGGGPQLLMQQLSKLPMGGVEKLMELIQQGQGAQAVAIIKSIPSLTE
jgi:hypothetical protein